MSFFSSDLAVAIAWICGIAGFIYGLIQKKANINLKLELMHLQQTVTNSIDQSGVAQLGDKNVYTKHNSGGMNIKM